MYDIETKTKTESESGEPANTRPQTQGPQALGPDPRPDLSIAEGYDNQEFRNDVPTINQ